MDDLHTKIRRKNLSEIIINRLMEGLLSGELKPGDKLPTEMKMAEMFGVGRNSVREATKILEAMGIVEIYRSDGVYIAKKYSKDILNPRIYGMILGKRSEKEVINTMHTFFLSILIRQLRNNICTVSDHMYSDLGLLKKEIDSGQNIHIITDLSEKLKLSLICTEENMEEYILKMLFAISREYRLRMVEELKSQSNLRLIPDYIEDLQQSIKSGMEHDLIEILSVDITNCEYFTKIFNENC